MKGQHLHDAALYEAVIDGSDFELGLHSAPFSCLSGNYIAILQASGIFRLLLLF